jgi:prolyl 4-hydroxylase
MAPILLKAGRSYEHWVCALTISLLSLCCLQSSSFALSAGAKEKITVTRLSSDVLKSTTAQDSCIEDANNEEPVLLHTFWGRERSEEEIKAHITEQLKGLVDDGIPVVTVLNSEPPLVFIDNFLSTDHCIQIIESAKDHLQRSTLGAEQQQSNTRTSTTAWIRDHQCETPLRRIASAVSRISGLPTSHMENLQVCRYQVGQQFAIHTDHLDSFNDLSVGGRLCTCLIYLQDCTLGGATTFPKLVVPNVKPVPGRAVFFWNTMERPGFINYKSDMFLNVDVNLQHAGMPVEEGEKWICNRWVHPVDIGSGVRGL